MSTDTGTQRVDRTSSLSVARSVVSVAVLSLTIFVTISFEMLPIGMLGMISRALGGSEQGAGLLVTAYAVTVVIAAVPLAAFTARFDARKLLALTLAVFAITAVAIAIAPSLQIAILARFLAGAAHAVIFTVVFRLALGILSPRRQSTAASAVSGANASAISLGVPAATALGVAAAWQLPFALIAYCFAALAIAVLLVIPPSVGMDEEALSARQVLIAVRQPALFKVGLTTVITMTAQFASFTYVEPLLRERGLPEEQVSAVLLGYGVAGVLGLLAVMRLTARFPSACFRWTVALVSLCLVGLALSVGSLVASVAFVIVWGLTFGALPVLVQVLALRGAGALPSVGAPVNNASFNIGIALGSMVGGILLSTINLTTLVVSSAGLMLLMFALSLIPRWLPEDSRTTGDGLEYA